MGDVVSIFGVCEKERVRDTERDAFTIVEKM